MLEVDKALLEQRRRTGIDRLDEMWEGVLHMAPAPANEHQFIATRLAAFLCAGLPGHAVLVQANVSTRQRWNSDYRIPDVSVVAGAPRSSEYVEPIAVFEVRSPGDESYEKLPFYAALRVADVVIIDRDTRAIDAFALGPDGYAQVTADAHGWVRVASVGVQLRTEPSALPRLQARMAGDASEPQSI